MAPSKISTRSTTAGLAILDAMQDPHLFGPWFTPEAPWRPWRAFLAALFGLRMSPEETAIFRACTGRQMLPMAPAREGWVIVGRRGGKSLTAAFVSVWLACFRDYRPFLAPGERAVLLVVAADRAQARLVFSYISAFLDEIPLLRPLVARRTSEVIDLTNRVTIEVGTASFRTIRGRTLIGAVADELAFWRSDDSANPDSEIITAIRPGMATIPGALLLAISSPYSRRGELWRAHKEHFGRDPPLPLAESVMYSFTRGSGNRNARRKGPTRPRFPAPGLRPGWGSGGSTGAMLLHERPSPWSEIPERPPRSPQAACSGPASPSARARARVRGRDHLCARSSSSTRSSEVEGRVRARTTPPEPARDRPRLSPR
jgi:hypothetical protein